MNYKKIDLFKYYAPTYTDSITDKQISNLDVLRTGNFFFQSPSNFNDPWDCHLSFRELPKSTEQLITEVTKTPESELLPDFIKLRKVISETPPHRLRGIIQNFPFSEYLENLKKSQEESTKDIRNLLGVSCMSATPFNELMWGHYAYNHKGFVLHIEIPRDEIGKKSYLTPIPVNYCEKPFSPNFRQLIGPPNVWALDLAGCKSKSWKYENEVRFITTEGKGFKTFPKHWLKSVIAGLDADDTLIENIKSISDKTGIAVYNAEQDSESFSISIPDFPISAEHCILQLEDYTKSLPALYTHDTD